MPALYAISARIESCFDVLLVAIIEGVIIIEMRSISSFLNSIIIDLFFAKIIFFQFFSNLRVTFSRFSEYIYRMCVFQV